MKKLKLIAILLLTVIIYVTFSGSGYPEEEEAIIRDMVIAYGEDGAAAYYRIDSLLDDLQGQSAYAGETWQEIMDYWRYASEDMALNFGSLPDGLGDGSGLCIVVLGYQLNPDGTLQRELEWRLGAALGSARKYPKAYVLCTGGGTASRAEDVTEAEQMAAWLINHGLDPSRIIVENKSMTTTQNAIRSYKILRSQYPEVDSVAIVSSDYHVAWGATMFQTQFTIAARELGDKMLKVVSNAAAYTGKEFKDALHYQAGGILSIAGIDS